MTPNSSFLSPDKPARFPDGISYTPTSTGILPAQALQGLDGLVLTGGGDVHPSHFGEPINGTEMDRISNERDALELSLARDALYRDIPVFGICRGFQVLNIAAGGGLIQHLDGHRSPKNTTAFHPVRLTPQSRIYDAAGSPVLSVNTFHHQGLNAQLVAPGFRPTGYADPDEWLVEAIESQNHAWVVGVQWHPERTFELERSHQLLWHHFIDACNKYRKSSSR